MLEKIQKSIDNAKAIYGDKYNYEAVEGTAVDLRKLKPDQQVCAGGKSWHILMTKKININDVKL